MVNNKEHKEKRDLECTLVIKEAIKKIESLNNSNDEKKDSSAKVELFFSFDIVNSTSYKEKNRSWASAITGIIVGLKDKVEGSIPQARLWRIIGDEVVFTCEIKNMQEVYEILNSIYHILVDNSAKSIPLGFGGNDACEKVFGLQAAAWVAAIKNYCGDDTAEINEYDNIRKDYKIASNRTINEFLGTDIDIGFRVKKETEQRRLAISFELASLLNEQTEYSGRLHIITYKELKGVWGGKPYPIIWYYDERMHNNVSFDDSFTYDESIQSRFAKEYFANNSGKSDTPSQLYANTDTVLKKICNDLCLKGKMDYLKSLIDSSSKDTRSSDDCFGEEMLELHVAAVCCDVEKRAIMLVRRIGRKSLNGKWEFGCSRACIEKHIEQSVADEYYKRFGLSVEVIVDTERDEKRAIPIAVYEIEKEGRIHKGILVVARIKAGIENVENVILSNGKHDCVRWITEADLDDLNEDGVNDYKNTMKKVFDGWGEYFDGR